MYRSCFQVAFGTVMVPQAHHGLRVDSSDAFGQLSDLANLDQRKMPTPLFEVDDDLDVGPSRSAQA